MKKLVLILAAFISSCQPAYAGTVVDMLKAEEGFRAKPYLGTEGYIHIGYGYKLHKDLGLDPSSFLLTVNEDIASKLLEIDINTIKIRLLHGVYGKIYEAQNEPVKDVLVSMTYQLGYSGILKFRKMWAALKVGDADAASSEALDSDWVEQTPARAARHAYTIETGKPYEYGNR